MKKIEIIEKLFGLYIALIIIFDFVTLPSVALPFGQLMISFFFIGLMLVTIFYSDSKRRIVWWSFFLISTLGSVRPVLEYVFSIVVPGAAQNFFPIFTPIFSIIGFLLMLPCFIILLDFKLMKEFGDA